MACEATAGKPSVTYARTQVAPAVSAAGPVRMLELYCTGGGDRRRYLKLNASNTFPGMPLPVPMYPDPT